MYVSPNFKSKAALKGAIVAGEVVRIFQPGPFSGNEPLEGVVAVEGPHYPKPHTWYARVILEDGRIVEVE